VIFACIAVSFITDESTLKVKLSDDDNKNEEVTTKTEGPIQIGNTT
jgi:hypothetical protein